MTTALIIIIAFIALYGAFRLGAHAAVIALKAAAREHLTEPEYLNFLAYMRKMFGGENE